MEKTKLKEENESQSKEDRTFLPWLSSPKLAWFILVFAAINVVFLGGKRRAFGVIVSELKVQFNGTSLAELNWIGDSYAALGYMTTGLSSAIILRCGRRYDLFQLFGALFVLSSCITSAIVVNPHWLFLTHTLLHGIGSSLILSCAGLIINEYFDKNHPYHILATTLVSGGSVASIIFVTFFAYLILQYGWRLSFIILGAFYFVINSSASLFYKKREKADQSDYRKTCSNCNFSGHVTIRHVPLLILWTLDRIMTSVVTYGLLLNLVDYMRRKNPNIVSSTLYTTLFALGEASTYLLGAIITAATKDILKDRLRYVLLVCTFLMGSCLVGWEYSAFDHVSSCIFAFFSGFFLGPSITFLFPAGEEISRLPGHIAYPFSLAGMGLGMLLSPFFSAIIATRTEYKNFFLVQAGIIYLKFVILVVASIVITACHPPLSRSGEYTNLDEDKIVSGETNEKTLSE